jgi:hypothetical protein
MENLKKELIAKYVIPLFGTEVSYAEQISDRLDGICKLHDVLKYGELEAPGSFEQARVFFSLEAMVHSYYYCTYKSVQKGTRIWKRLNFILFSSCLLEKEVRTDYVQMLEPGKVLSFSYRDLLTLMEDFPTVRIYFGHVFNSNESYYHHRNIFLNKPPIERTKHLREENPYFINIASQQIQAIHVNLCLRAYINQIKKLR